METVVLIGGAIAHSRSPRLHNHLFALYDLPFRYQLMPLDESAVAPFVETMKRGGYRGANITSPHKRAALPALDELDEVAEAIGAVNTIVIDGHRAVGHNTDAHGFAVPLLEHPVTRGTFSAAVLGTGGAAMAAVYALLRFDGLRALTIYSRDHARAAAAAARWNDGRVHDGVVSDYGGADLLVNATPVGLAGSDRLPLPAGPPEGTALVYEMIYWPAETPLLRVARERGMETIGGAAMFVAQALESFRLWTGITPRAGDVPADLFGGA